MNGIKRTTVQSHKGCLKYYNFIGYLLSRGSLSGPENNLEIHCKTSLIFIALVLSAFIQPTKSMYSAALSLSRTCKAQFIQNILTQLVISINIKEHQIATPCCLITKSKTKYKP